MNNITKIDFVPVENVLTVTREVYAFLVNALTERCPTVEKLCRRWTHFKAIADGTVEPTSSEYVDFKFDDEEGRGEVSLALHTDYFGARERFEDPQGNIWAKTKVFVQVSWPCYGMEVPSLSLRRLALMTEIAELAQRLTDHFADQPLWSMIVTKAERDESRREAAERELQSKIDTIVAKEAKGMRIKTAAKWVKIDDDIPAATYTSTIGNKSFRLDVTYHNSGEKYTFGFLSRTA